MGGKMFLFRRNGNWHVEYIDKMTGRAKRISTQCKLKQDAIQFVSRFEEELAERQTVKLTPIPLSKFRDEFLEHSRIIHSIKTTSDYGYLFTGLLRIFGDVQLKSFTRSTIENYVESRLRDASAYAARKELAYLSSMFNYAIPKNYLLANPCKGIKKPKLPEKLPVFFSREEFQMLLTNIHDEAMKAIVLFAVNTGLRRMEILTLEWGQVNLKDGILILHNQNHLTKSRKVRSVPLNKAALEILNKQRDKIGSELVFTRKGKPLTQDFVSHEFKRCVRRAQLNPKLHFHSLRHTFGSWLVQRGVSIYQVSKLLGHSSVNVTAIYAHLQTDNLRESVQKLIEASN